MSNITVQNVNDNFFGETIDQTSFRPPRVIIGQPTSTGKQPGKFNMPDGSAVEEMTNVIVISPSQSRVLYAGKRQPAICASDNFFQPSPRIKEPLSQSCQTCVYSAWGYEAEKMALAKKHNLSISNFEKPMCKASYDMIMADADRNPFRITFQSTMRKVVEEKLLSILKRWNRTQPKCAIEFDMKLVPLSTSKGDYYNIVFQGFRNAKDLEKCVELHSQISTLAQKIFAEEYAEMDEQNRQAMEKTVNEPDFGEPPQRFNDDEIPF